MKFARSFVVLLTAACLLTLAAPSQAAPAPLVIKDDKGDALDVRPEMDIVSLTLESKNFKPKDTPSLVVTLELAGPINRSTATAVNYNIDTEIPGCGYLQFTYSPGTVLEGGPGAGAYSNISTSCGGEPSTTGDGTYLGVDAKVELNGNKLVMWTSWASLTKEIRAQDTVGEISATVEIAEPVFGIIGAGIFGPTTATDSVTTDKTWKYA